MTRGGGLSAWALGLLVLVACQEDEENVLTCGTLADCPAGYLACVNGRCARTAGELDGKDAEPDDLGAADAARVADASLPVADGSLPVADASLPVADASIPAADASIPAADGGVAAADAGAGLVPACRDLPDPACDEGAAACAVLGRFDPPEGPGYYDPPVNGETDDDQYRSFARLDVRRIVQHAAAKVACLAADWEEGNGGPVGLGDMSEADGAIPGTSVGSPGHPQGTHTGGLDIDIGYFQTGTEDNGLRAVCDTLDGDAEAFHCVGPPDLLDARRTALLVGVLHESPQLRVVGVDGQIGLALEEALDALCDEGLLEGPVCDGERKLAYEVEDMGAGFFRFHYGAMYVSFRAP